MARLKVREIEETQMCLQTTHTYTHVSVCVCVMCATHRAGGRRRERARVAQTCLRSCNNGIQVCVCNVFVTIWALRFNSRALLSNDCKDDEAVCEEWSHIKYAICMMQTVLSAGCHPLLFFCATLKQQRHSMLPHNTQANHRRTAGSAILLSTLMAAKHRHPHHQRPRVS